MLWVVLLGQTTFSVFFMLAEWLTDGSSPDPFPPPQRKMEKMVWPYETMLRACGMAT